MHSSRAGTTSPRITAIPPGELARPRITRLTIIPGAVTRPRMAMPRRLVAFLLPSVHALCTPTRPPRGVPQSADEMMERAAASVRRAAEAGHGRSKVPGGAAAVPLTKRTVLASSMASLPLLSGVAPPITEPVNGNVAFRRFQHMGGGFYPTPRGLRVKLCPPNSNQLLLEPQTLVPPKVAAPSRPSEVVLTLMMLEMSHPRASSRHT